MSQELRMFQDIPVQTTGVKAGAEKRLDAVKADR